jgi:hypothetical protein
MSAYEPEKICLPSTNNKIKNSIINFHNNKVIIGISELDAGGN